MSLFISNKTKGFWSFSDDELGDMSADVPYYNCKQVLIELLDLLKDSKLLLPRKMVMNRIEIPCDLGTEELVDLIFKTKEAKCDFDITGDTIIYTKSGEELYSGIFELVDFRMYEQSISLRTRSDIWLPMAFDIDTYKYYWNLERYELNYHRIEKILERINSCLSWNSNSQNERDHYDFGFIQIGYKLFLDGMILKREYEKNPNVDFDIDAYLKEIDEALVQSHNEIVGDGKNKEHKVKEICRNDWDFVLYEVDDKMIIEVVFFGFVDYSKKFLLLDEEYTVGLEYLKVLSEKIRNNYELYKDREVESWIPPVN